MRYTIVRGPHKLENHVTASTPEQRQEAPVDLKRLPSARKHRRESRREIVLPVLGVGLAILLVTVLVVLVFPRQDDQTSIVSGVVLICLTLFPVILCLFLLYAALIASLYYTGRANRATARALRQTQVASRSLTDRVNTTADRANRLSIDFNARFSRFDPILKRFDRRDDTPPQPTEEPTDE